MSIDKLKSIVELVNTYKGNLRACFEAGYDSVASGANESNCHFGYFSTPEMTKAWERGAAEAKKVLNP